MALYGDCEICVTEETRFTDRKQAAHVVLVGNYAATLCPDCRNAWHEYITPYEAYRALVAAEVEVKAGEIASNPPTFIDARKLLEAQVAAQEALYPITKSWVAARRESFQKGRK